jgi:hypothetical protein
MNNNSPVARFLHRLIGHVSVEEARLIANTLGSDPYLSHWLLTAFVSAGQPQRAMLIRAAQIMRDELCNYTIASVLERLADDPALLRAVVREIRASSTSASAHSRAPQAA